MYEYYLEYEWFVIMPSYKVILLFFWKLLLPAFTISSSLSKALARFHTIPSCYNYRLTSVNWELIVLITVNIYKQLLWTFWLELIKIVDVNCWPNLPRHMHKTWVLVYICMLLSFVLLLLIVNYNPRYIVTWTIFGTEYIINV